MATLYRVENTLTDIGLWYNGFGEKTDFIVHEIQDAQCRDLPMDFDPAFKDGGDWRSACDSLESMREWFSMSDLKQFTQKGYGLYTLEVPNYRMTNGHAIFLREQVISATPADIALLER